MAPLKMCYLALLPIDLELVVGPIEKLAEWCSIKRKIFIALQSLFQLLGRIDGRVSLRSQSSDIGKNEKSEDAQNHQFRNHSTEL